ncbi:MAG: hypothetical protein H6568_10235 [Lewinellaceae bacterium]|nr:hypothetical protein [Lewinellaceae bacterium]
MFRLLSAVSFLFLFACQPGTPPAEQVAGDWQGARWEANGNPVTDDPTRVVFMFQPPDRYAAVFGNQQEAGVYRVNDGRLYTQADGQAQIMVRFDRPDPDTLTLQMNRGGRMETLVLGRRK